jgi:cytochrome c-type biogenesis protein CcmE
MKVVRRRKLAMILVIGISLSLAIGLVLYALRQNISLFFSPTQISLGEAPLNHNIRVGGMVKEGSIIREKNSLQVQFKITDFSHTMTVNYQGILPDLFREGQGIVAEGILLDQHHFNANQVLAKHDANYMPPEVKASLAKQKRDV